MKKLLTIGLPILVVAIGIALIFIFGIGTSKQEDNLASDTAPNQTESTATEPQDSTQATTQASAGKYATYSDSAVKDAGYDQTVVFFYAPWCPECRAFKQAINSGEIPAGTQILEADYDSSTSLKKQYGVTLQSTFVRVDTDGSLQKKWVGYGKDKSLSTVLDNLR